VRELSPAVDAGRDEEELLAMLRGDSSTVMGLAALPTLMGAAVPTLIRALPTLALPTLALPMLAVRALIRALPTVLGMLPTPPMLAAVLAVSGVSARTPCSRSRSMRAVTARPCCLIRMRSSRRASCFFWRSAWLCRSARMCFAAATLGGALAML
jgi:hypothetical protein